MGGVVASRADWNAGCYDIVMAFGVLHHLDDAEGRELFRGARRALKPGGRFVTLDTPSFRNNQRNRG
jgi:SAM-dependent methyltransferase